LKKPHALIGLLAAVGTAIGVLVAVVGLPYGRMDYSAFAGIYHNGGTPDPGFHMALDCDTGTVGVQDNCNVEQPGGPLPYDVDATLGNNTGLADTVGAIGQGVFNPDTTRISAVAAGAGDSNQDGNPDFNQAYVTGSWNCSLLPPSPDIDGGAPENSRIDCFNTAGNGPAIAAFPADHPTLYTVHYVIPALAPIGSVTLSFDNAVVGNNDGIELMSCNPVITNAGGCYSATINIVEPPPEPTATPTNTPTNTPTATATVPGGNVVKIPESCIDPGDPDNCDPNIPAANLWICVNPAPCAGPGEGNLYVYEYASGVITQGDQDGDTIPDGLGAYEFQVEYDNFVIQSLNPEDIVFNPGPVAPYPNGTDGVADGEGGSRGPANCSFSLIQENRIRFGCVTIGLEPEGPIGEFDLARLNLIPHPDLTNDIFPGNDNGVVTVLKDNGCELVDILGHPTAGSVNGGLTPVCGDLAVTVRILEGDLDLDCDVDVADAQKIAFRYGSFFGSLLYSQWYDLEPNLHDLDIDIKDLQKVFGRIGSTCQDPVGPQPPAPPPAPFGN
jgi:hypothetical protein